LAGEAARERYGHPLPDETLAAVRAAGVALKGPLFAPKQTGRVTIRTDGLFLQYGRDVAAGFPNIAFWEAEHGRRTSRERSSERCRTLSHQPFRS
jgi:hypothetical protein